MASLKKNTTVRGSDDDRGNGELILSQDVEWLFSFSEPELDFLICLKELAIRRAKNAGCKDLADKFDVRMLHALARRDAALLHLDAQTTWSLDTL